MKMKGLIASMLVGIMIVGSLPLGIGTVGATPVSRDSDNDFTTATPVTSDDITITSDLTGNGDTNDFYKIQLNNSGGGNAEVLMVTATSLGGVGNPVRLNIFDPNTYWISTDSSLSFPSSYLKVFAEWSGWYYVSIEGQGLTFNYKLRFQKTTAGWVGDSNTNAANADVMSVFPYNVTKTYNNVTDTQDFYKVHLEKVAGDHIDILMVKFTPPTGVEQAAVAEMYYASNNTGVPGWFNTKGSSFVTNPKGTIFTFTPVVTGDYLLRIWGHLNVTSYGFKAIKVTAALDTNLDKNSAVSILGTGKQHADSAAESGAVVVDYNDYFKFTGKKGMRVNATLDSLDYTQDMNLPVFYLHLLNQSDYEYAEAELNVFRTTADPQAVIEGSLPTNDTYYLWVECLGGAGNYRLNVTANTPPQFIDAKVLDPSYSMFIWENGTNTSLSMNNVFADYDGDPMTYSSDTNVNMTVTINPTTTVVTFTPKLGFKDSLHKTCMNLTATDDHTGTGTHMVCAKVYGINHAPYIKKLFNETLPGGVLVMKTTEINTTINIFNYVGDSDQYDKHWITITGQDKIHITAAEEKPMTPDHYHTGLLTILAPNAEVIENIKFVVRDNGVPRLESVPLNLSIQVSTGEVRILTKPGGELKFNEDGTGTFSVKDYLTFKPPVPADDTIAFTAEVPANVNLTVSITAGVATITPSPSDWCGSGVIKFTGKGVKNTQATNSTNLKVTVACINDPPVIGDYTPKGEVTMAEGAKQEFTVTAADPDTAISQIKYTWLVDNVQQSSVKSSYNYSPNFEMSGKHNVTVIVNDTYLEVRYTWANVTVTDVNRFPANVKVLEPLNNASFLKGKKVTFKAATATDADKDVPEYTWYDNGVVMGKGQVFENYKFTKKGTHTVKLVVSDGRGGDTSAEISVKVKEPPAKPVIPGFEGVLVFGAIIAAVVAVVGLSRRNK